MAAVEERLAGIETQLEAANAKLDSLTVTICGNGAPEKSHKVRLALVERDVKRIVWGIGAAFVAAVSAIVKSFV